MSSSDFLKDYSLVEPTIRKLYDSRLRISILDALSNGPMRLADLKRRVKANAPNTSSKAKELEEMGMVERAEGDYRLTPYGRAVRMRVQESFDFYATYQRFRGFWEARDTTAIPDSLWCRLGELKESRLMLADPGDVRAIDEKFYELMRGSKRFWRGLFPVIDLEWAKIGMEMFDRSLEFELIVTSSVLDGLKKNLKEPEKAAIGGYERLHFLEISGDPPITFAVADNFFSINLRLKHYDTKFQEADLLSFDPGAIRWGLELFDYYKKQAKPVKLDEYS